MDTCTRCGKELGFFEKRNQSIMFKNALKYGLFPEYRDKKICLSCEYELLDSQGIKYHGRKEQKQGMARIRELAKKQNTNRARYSYWKVLSSFSYVYGGVSLLLGVYIYLYYQTTWIASIGVALYSYRNYGIPLIIAGIALMIMCYAIRQRTIPERKGVEKQEPITNIDICASCGAKRDTDAQYCKKCGKKFT